MGEPAPEGGGGPRPAWADRLAAAEVELAALRSHVASLVEATGSIVWVADTERGFVEPQPDWADYTGQTPAEYAGFGYMDAVHPDDRKALGAANRAAGRGEVVWVAEARLWHAATGTYRHCVSRGAPLRDETGAVTGWVGVCTDIHEQVAAREDAEAVSAAARRAQRAAEEAQREAEEAAAAAEAANRRLRQLQEISDVAVSRLPLADLVAALRNRLQAVLAVDTVRILLLDERTKLLRPAALEPDDPAGADFSLPLGRGFGGRVALAGGPVIEPDAGAVERLDPLILAVRSLAGVPLLVGDRLVGVLHVGTRERRVFTRADVELLELAAERVAAAMERSRAFERERTLARTLQAALLPPSLPAIPGVALSARYIAAGEGLDVGGDFYDVFAVGDGAWLAVIGDVCGRGPEAAAMTGLARHTVRAVAGERVGPAEVLRRLNSALAAEAGDERFATAVCARLEPDPAGGRARLVLASGGHCRPILLRGDGTVEPVAVGGTLLGAFPDVRLDEVSVDLGPGDSLVLYTDGVVEAQGIGGFFGEWRLLRLLASAAGRTGAEVAGLVEEAVSSHAGGPPDDDLALMVLQVPSPLPPTPDVLVDTALPAGEAAAGEARRAVERALGGRLPDDDLDAVRLVASELVTNAVRHGRPDTGGPRLRVLSGGSAVRVEVRNRGRAFALPTERAALLDESGRGLDVVRHLARAVGVDEEGPSVAVWALLELAVP
ncbi:MAG TPA: SpoIIE family protein phosphatase [Acidimicrobiia bacterium]|nr:SpoIIE family protein phosphatase [Acidimicrobiia bacterium]HZQ75894.1 SpoIIE family protein phosphatase [Acidimicrobiia bacterium]